MIEVHVLGISGSLRAGSWNSLLLEAAGGLLPLGATMRIYAGLELVPPYSEDSDVEPAPAAVAHLRAAIDDADAILLATPEYNASVPGQLKNALDWASRPYPGNVLRGKPAATIGASTGLFGAVWAQAELAKVLTTAGARMIGSELPIPSAHEAFDHDRRLCDPDLSHALERLLFALVDGARPVGPVLA